MPRLPRVPCVQLECMRGPTSPLDVPPGTAVRLFQTFAPPPYVKGKDRNMFKCCIPFLAGVCACLVPPPHQYRGMMTSTDILSFPNNDMSGAPGILPKASRVFLCQQPELTLPALGSIATFPGVGERVPLQFSCLRLERVVVDASL